MRYGGDGSKGIKESEWDGNRVIERERETMHDVCMALYCV